jgi:cell division protein FtsI/penicillin-binding protein 2
MMSTVFWYTVLEHSYYQEFAEKQQKTILKNPASRGNITSSTESLEWVLAVSTNLGTLAIDPTQSGSHEKLLTFLADVVFEEFCKHSQSECIPNMSNYLRTDFSNDEKITEISIKDKIKSYIKERMETPIQSVEIAQKIDEKTRETILSWNNDALYFVVDNLYVDPTRVKNVSLLVTLLHNSLWIDENILKDKLSIRKRRHLEIIRKMSIGTRDIVNKRIDTEFQAVKNKQLTALEAVYPFLKIDDNLVRYYPEGRTTGQITGFVDGEGKWKYGIEGYFEGDLQRESPVQTVVKDIAGRPIRDYVSENSLTLKSGVDIALTIDRNLQKEISRRLGEAIRSFRANKWSVVVMNPKTGAILAMVNYPDFDPNSFTEVYEMERVQYSRYPNPSFDLLGYPLFIEDSSSGSINVNIEGKSLRLREATSDEVANFALIKYKYKNDFWAGNYKNDIMSSLYEPGSVFKAITTAIGIDTGEIKPDDTYYDRGFVELDMGGWVKRKISNVSSECIGMHTYIHGLDWSCNVGMISIVEKIGRALFYQYINDFGFTSKTNVTMDGEVYAQVSSYEKWPRIQFFNMSFGQGINVTMLQMAAAYSVLANGGVYMQPYIVESILYPDGKRIETVPTPLRRVIKEDTAKQVTAMLVDWVQKWFAKAGWVKWYTIAGKTGTSQIASKWWYEIGEAWHTVTSFGWYAPANNPKFVLIVRIDRPRSAQYSESTSSALFANIAKYLLEYYKIPKNSDGLQ